MAETGGDETAVALQREIRETFDRLKVTGQLSGSVRGNDIGAVVAKFIKRGMSISAAEDVLRQAGFEFVPPPQTPDDTMSSSHEIYARSARILQGGTFGITNEVVVTLVPATGAVDGAVSSMSARIYVTSL